MDGNEGEFTVSNIRMMDETSQKALLFKSIRGKQSQMNSVIYSNSSCLALKAAIYMLFATYSKRIGTYSTPK